MSEESSTGLVESSTGLVIRPMKAGEEDDVRDMVFSSNQWTVMWWGITKRVLLFDWRLVAFLVIVAIMLQYWFDMVLVTLLVVVFLPLVAYWILYLQANKTFTDLVLGDLRNVEGRYVRPNRANLLVAEFMGEIIGCVAVEEASKNTAVLRSLTLDASYRGLGIGKKLMEDILEFCREHGYKEVKLGTIESRVAAQGLFRKYGFVRTGSRYVPLPLGKKLEIRQYSLEL